MYSVGGDQGLAGSIALDSYNLVMLLYAGRDIEARGYLL